MKRGTPDHPKMLALAEAIQAYLESTRPESNLPLDMCQTLACGILERLWHFTARYAPAGDVGKRRDSSVARAVGWTFDAQSLLRMLVETGWLDQLPDGMLYVHDWHTHCDDGCDKHLRDNQLTYYGGQPPRRKPEKSRPHRDKSKLVKTPKPLPLPAPKPLPLPSGEVEAAVADLISLGAEAGAARNAVSTATGNGVTLGQVQQVIDFWNQHRHWGVGALVNRIRNATPRSDPDRGWPEQIKPNNGQPSPQKVAEERHYAAQQIIAKGRRAKKSDDEITKDLAAAGLEWNT